MTNSMDVDKLRSQLQESKRERDKFKRLYEEWHALYNNEHNENTRLKHKVAVCKQALLLYAYSIPGDNQTAKDTLNRCAEVDSVGFVGDL